MQISISEAARRLGVSASYVAKLSNAGKLPTVRTLYGRTFELSYMLTLTAERAKNPPKCGPKSQEMARRTDRFGTCGRGMGIYWGS